MKPSTIIARITQGTENSEVLPLRRDKLSVLMTKNYSHVKMLIMVIVLGIGSIVAHGQVVVKVRPAMPRTTAVRPLCPGANHVWTGGYWKYNRKINNYVWIDGHWARPRRRGAAWVDGHWRQSRGGWVYIRGHWG